jgi:hypothetical protein
VFDDNLQNELLKYTTTTMLFSDKNVDSSLISWNRVVLLHGVFKHFLIHSPQEQEKHHFVKLYLRNYQLNFQIYIKLHNY